MKLTVAETLIRFFIPRLLWLNMENIAQSLQVRLKVCCHWPNERHTRRGNENIKKHYSSDLEAVATVRMYWEVELRSEFICKLDRMLCASSTSAQLSIKSPRSVNVDAS